MAAAPALARSCSSRQGASKSAARLSSARLPADVPVWCAPSPVLDAELETALAALLEQKRALSRALETQVAKVEEEHARIQARHSIMRI